MPPSLIPMSMGFDVLPRWSGQFNSSELIARRWQRGKGMLCIKQSNLRNPTRFRINL